jgi:hypothetical protein
MQRSQQRSRCSVAAQDGEWLKGTGGIFSCGNASNREATIDDRHVIAMTGKEEGSGKAGRVAA